MDAAMAEARYLFTRPKSPGLRWLTDPGAHVPAQIGTILLSEIFASPKALIAGVINGLVLDTVALCMHGGRVFGLFILLELALAAIRAASLRRTLTGSSAGLPAPTSLYLIAALCWCALQGAMAYVAMRTSILPLQLLTATTVMAMIGPICARNYPAPRYAMALVMLCDLPFIAGAAFSGNRWLLVLILQTPLFLLAVFSVTKRFQAMAVAAFQAEQDNHQRARRDSLTGLLNRFGLMEMFDLRHTTVTRPFTLFYLDLDGFKPINDTFGHHVGDKILQAVAARLTSCIREGDVVSRLGGDEFVIIAPDMMAMEGSAFAEAIIRAIADESYEISPAGSLPIGISVGFACAPEDGVVGDELHRKADAALYQAKAAGRGVHRRYVPPSEENGPMTPRVRSAQRQTMAA